MKRNDLLALAGVLALFTAVCAAIGPFHPERSFVTYRFAENFAAGRGLTYSAGDAPVEGYANTAWVMACAALARAGFALPATAWLLSFLAGAAALCLAWVLARMHGGVLASFAALQFAAASGPLAIAAMSGEGAALTAALALLLVVLLRRAGARLWLWVLAGVTGILLAACAHALVIVYPLALALRVAGARGMAAPRAGWISSAVLFVAGVVALHAWRMNVFGALLAPAPGFAAGRASLADLFVSQPYDMAPFGLFYLLLLASALVGARVSKHPVSWLAIATALTVGMVTMSSRDPLPGLAESAALVPLLVIPMAPLIEIALARVPGRALGAALVSALLLASLSGAMDLRVFAGHIRESHDTTLAPLGRWLAAWRPDGTLLTDAPGAVPYYAGWRTEVVTDAAMPFEGPDAVVLTSLGLFTADMQPASQHVAGALSGRYRVLAAIRRDWTRDRAFIIYARNDIPELSDSLTASFPHGLGTVARLNR